ncbi:hypothetical protein [Escherichia coli]
MSFRSTERQTPMTSTILENLPQIITSLAALITAVTGLIKVLRDKDK